MATQAHQLWVHKPAAGQSTPLLGMVGHRIGATQAIKALRLPPPIAAHPATTMAPFLPSSLYSTALPLAAVAAGQREQQQAVAYSVAERSSLTMAAAPAEKKIAMYSKVLMQRGEGLWPPRGP